MTTEPLAWEQGDASGDTSPAALAALRTTMLSAVQRDDMAAIPAGLQRYQALLEAVLRRHALTPDHLARFESEHNRFHEQLRAMLLTTRFAIRKEIERVRVSRSYGTSERARQSIDISG